MFEGSITLWLALWASHVLKVTILSKMVISAYFGLFEGLRIIISGKKLYSPFLLLSTIFLNYISAFYHYFENSCFLGDFPIFRPPSSRTREVLTLIFLDLDSMHPILKSKK